MNETDEQVNARLQAEGDAIRAGIVEITLAWSRVEDDLMLLLLSCIGSDRWEMASAILFSVTGLDARLSIAKAALHAAAKDFTQSEDFSRNVNRLFSKLKDKKDVRNRVAHGSIMGVTIRDVPHMRLTAAAFDFGRNAAEYERRQGDVGFTGEQILHAGATLDAHRQKIKQFARLIELWRRQNLAEFGTLLAELSVPAEAE